MKRYLILGLVLALGLVAFTAPIKNIEVRLTQPDGQVVNCYASGDEYYNYLHDANGFTIVQGEGGYYYYATKGNRGEVAASQYIVGKVNPASVGLEPYVKISEKEYYARREKWEAPLNSQLSTLNSRRFSNGRELNHGLYNNLVVFIRFAGDTYHTTPFSTVDDMFNADGWDDVSLHNYYHHTSYSQLDLWSYFYPQPDGETVLSYEDIYPKQYYQPYNAVTNPIGYLDENRAEREFDLLERAIEYIEDMVPEDLELDYNGDGKVDNVVFVCKGENGNWNSLLWPHRWYIWDRDVWLGDLQVYDFNLQLEQGGYFTVSTLCHEMFHSLSAPDLYHYETGGNPAGSWDLMCSNTDPPQQPNVYLKYKYGNWIDEIPLISQPGTYEIEANVWEGGRRNGYRIPTSDPNQFIFIEYRDKRNVFEGQISGSGLLIYRIDTRFDGNAGNNGYSVFDEVYLFRPGGTFTDDGELSQAHFNQKTGRTSFNNSTDPYPFYSNGSYCDWGYEITNISATGDRMSFDLLPYGSEGGGPLIENFTAHVNRLEHQVELSWDANPNADYYKVYCDGTEIGDVTETFFVHPYTEADNGYHVYSVMHVTGGTMHVYHALTDAWVILGNYETIDIDLACDSPYGTKGGELEVNFSHPAMKTQYYTIYDGTEAHAEIQVPANTEVTFNWHSGFDPESEGIRVKASHRNSNAQGDIFGMESPASGTLATYTASDEGLGVMAPQTINVNTIGNDVQFHWTIPTENQHFAIYREGRLLSSEVAGYEYLDNSIMRSGCYSYQVETIEGQASSWHPENMAFAAVMNYYCEPPRNLSGTHSSNQNELQWEAPEFMGYGLLAYDNNKYEEKFGSASQKWGIKFEPEQLAFFEGRPLAYLEMFDCTAATYTYKIYSGDKAINSNLVYTQNHQMTGSQEWVRFALDENVAYDASQTLWIAVQSTGGDKPIPCCAYVNLDNSCMVVSNSTWRPVTYYNLHHSWMLRAYTTQGDMSGDLSYNLYWGDEESNDEQMMLGMENLAATSVVHNSNDNLRYNVTAVIDGRETDFSNTIYLGPSVEVEEASEPDYFAYVNNGNIIINNIDNNSVLQIIDMTGRVVVFRGNRIPTDGMAPGVYVLRIISGSDVKTQKIVLR